MLRPASRGFVCDVLCHFGSPLFRPRMKLGRSKVKENKLSTKWLMMVLKLAMVKNVPCCIVSENQLKIMRWSVCRRYKKG